MRIGGGRTRERLVNNMPHGRSYRPIWDNAEHVRRLKKDGFVTHARPQRCSRCRREAKYIHETTGMTMECYLSALNTGKDCNGERMPQ